MGRRVATAEVREDGGLEVGSDFGSGAKWSDSSYILKPLESPDRPGVGVWGLQKWSISQGFGPGQL